MGATWAEVVDDGALLLAAARRRLLVARGLAEGLGFRGNPLWGGGQMRPAVTAGVGHGDEGWRGPSAASPMCSMASLMTSHSMGHRGAGKGPRAEGRAKRARGSPGNPQPRERTGSSALGAAGGAGGLPAPRHGTGGAQGARAGRVGDSAPGVTPQTTRHPQAGTRTPAGVTQPHSPVPGGFTHGSAPSPRAAGSRGRRCPGTRSVLVGTRGSASLPSSGLGEERCWSPNEGSCTPGDKGGDSPRLTSEVAVVAQVAAHEAVVGLGDHLGRAAPSGSAQGSPHPQGLQPPALLP